MDRFVVRETRAASGFPPPQPQQLLGYPQNTQPNNIPEQVYYEGRYAGKFPGMQHGGDVNGSGFMGIVHANASTYPQNINFAMSSGPGQIVSGIDPRYLASYASGNASYIMNGNNTMTNMNANSVFGGEYQNRSFVGADRNKNVTFIPQVVEEHTIVHSKPGQMKYDNTNMTSSNINSYNTVYTKSKIDSNITRKSPPKLPNAVTPKVVEDVKIVEQNQTKTRFEILKALHKTGPRAFSGPVEKVLKWHRALQDIGVLVIYEIVAKCVSVRPGESCVKHLVVRDDNGPAMQVVYYEIDFLLPEIKVPCTVRVVGRMLAGTCRLQAFNVRPATGDDVATLPRRAAAAAHHVAKLCKEYNINVH